MTVPDYDPASHYDRVTQAWGLLLGDELHYGVFRTGTEALAEATHALTDEMVGAASLEPGLRVLDVGCGTGAPACRLVTEQHVDVLGITTSDVGVDAARQRARREGIADHAAFENRDGMDTRLPDQDFDRVWVLEASHLMRDRKALVRECARLLHSGGRVTLCDIVLRREMPFIEVRKRHQEFALLRDVFGDARMEPLERYHGMYEDAGIEVDVEIDLTDATRPTFDRWRSNAKTHRDEVVRLIGEEDHGKFVRACDVLEGFWTDGTLGYGLIAGRRR